MIPDILIIITSILSLHTIIQLISLFGIDEIEQLLLRMGFMYSCNQCIVERTVNYAQMDNINELIDEMYQIYSELNNLTKMIIKE